MAAEVVWLDQARDDLCELLDFLHPSNPTAALRYVDELEHACEGLADFPMQGWQYDERYRAVVVRNHLIFYRFEHSQNKIVVVAVIDGRRDLTRILGDR